MKVKGTRELFLVFLIALIASGYFHSQDDVNSNSRLALVKAIVEENRFEIDSYHDGELKTEDQSFYNGHYFSDKAIGSSLVGAEFYTYIYKLRGGSAHLLSIDVFKTLITLLAISLLCACLAPLLFSFGRQITKSARFALLTSAAICFGTPFYVYGSAYYGHSLAALLLFAAFYVWFEMNTAASIRRTPVFCSGCLLGFSVITEYPTAMIALAIGIYLLYVMHKHQQLLSLRLHLAFLLGLAISAGALFLYNYTAFGDPLAIGYSYESVGAFRAVQSTGFMGLGTPDLIVLFYTTFHTTMGIFWQSPILLLAFPGWIAMWRSRKYRAEAVLSAGVAVGYFVMLSGYFAWWGGLSFTPRHLVPALPFFGIPLAFLTDRIRKVAFPLTLISVMQMLVVMATRSDGLGNITSGYSQGVVYKMFQNSTIYNVYLPNLLAGRLAPNLGGELLGLKGSASLIPFVVIEIGLLASFWIVTRGSRGNQLDWLPLNKA